MRKELRVLRAKHDLTQKDLAQKLGVEKASYCRKENGKSAFSLEDVIKLKNIFNLTPEEVVKIFLN
nr:helix-turn-helix transcriptional regulator [[Eubacterium] tenue]